MSLTGLTGSSVGLSTSQLFFAIMTVESLNLQILAGHTASTLKSNPAIPVCSGPCQQLLQ